MPRLVATLIASFLLMGSVASPVFAQRYSVFTGTLGGEGSEGIYVFEFDSDTGEIADLRVAARGSRPGFLALHPSRPILYAVDHTAQSRGLLRAFAIDPATHHLRETGYAFTGGINAAHVSLDPQARSLFAAHYTSGSLAVFPLRSDPDLSMFIMSEHTGPAISSEITPIPPELAPLHRDVQLFTYEGSSIHPRRQTRPYAHCTRVSPDGRHAYVTDLGTDRIHGYVLDPNTGAPTPLDPPFATVSPGDGPRHLAFSADGTALYVSNELSSSVAHFERDSTTGALSRRSTVSTLPAGFSGDNTVSEVALHPNGRFLYAANRGHDSIAIFSVDPATGQLAWLEAPSCGGRTPRFFAVAPTGRHLLVANQRSNRVNVFDLDPETGHITPTDHALEIPTPSCFVFLERP